MNSNLNKLNLVLNLAGTLPDNVTEFFSDHNLILKATIEDGEQQKVRGVLIKDESISLKKINQEFSLVSRDIPIISFGPVKDLKEFVLSNGKAVFDLAVISGDILLHHLGRIFNIETTPLILESKRKFVIPSTLATGYYEDQIASLAQDCGKNVISQKIFFSSFLSYLAVLALEKKVYFPIEAEIGEIDDFLVMRFVLDAESYQLENLLESYALDTSITDSYQILAKQSHQHTDLLTIECVPQNKKVVFTAYWNSLNERLSHSLILRNVSGQDHLKLQYKNALQGKLSLFKDSHQDLTEKLAIENISYVPSKKENSAIVTKTALFISCLKFIAESPIFADQESSTDVISRETIEEILCSHPDSPMSELESEDVDYLKEIVRAQGARLKKDKDYFNVSESEELSHSVVTSILGDKRLEDTVRFVAPLALEGNDSVCVKGFIPEQEDLISVKKYVQKLAEIYLDKVSLGFESQKTLTEFFDEFCDGALSQTPLRQEVIAAYARYLMELSGSFLAKSPCAKEAFVESILSKIQSFRPSALEISSFKEKMEQLKALSYFVWFLKNKDDTDALTESLRSDLVFLGIPEVICDHHLSLPTTPSFADYKIIIELMLSKVSEHSLSSQKSALEKLDELKNKVSLTKEKISLDTIQGLIKETYPDFSEEQLDLISKKLAEHFSERVIAENLQREVPIKNKEEMIPDQLINELKEKEQEILKLRQIASHLQSKLKIADDQKILNATDKELVTYCQKLKLALAQKEKQLREEKNQKNELMIKLKKEQDSSSLATLHVINERAQVVDSKAEADRKHLIGLLGMAKKRLAELSERVEVDRLKNIKGVPTSEQPLLQNATKQISLLKNEIEKRKESENQLRRELIQANADFTERLKNIEKQKTVTEITDQTSEAKKETTDNLYKELENMSEALGEAKGKISVLERQLEVAVSEIKNEDSKAGQLHIQKLNETIERMSSQIDSKTKELQSTRQELTAAEREVSKLSNEKSTLTQKLDTTGVDRIKEKNDLLLMENHKLKGENSLLRSKNEGVERQLLQANKKMIENESKERGGNGEALAFKQEIHKLKTALGKAEEAYKKERLTNKQHEAQIGILERQLKTAHGTPQPKSGDTKSKDSATLEEQQRLMKANVKKIEIERDRLQETLDKMQKESLERKGEMNKLKTEVTLLQGKLKEFEKKGGPKAA